MQTLRGHVLTVLVLSLLVSASANAQGRQSLGTLQNSLVRVTHLSADSIWAPPSMSLDVTAPSMSYQAPMPTGGSITSTLPADNMTKEQLLLSLPSLSGSSAPPTLVGAPIAGASWDENGVNAVPADPSVAASPTQVVEVTNASIDVWSGSTHKTAPLYILVSSSDKLTDTHVLYDSSAARWVVIVDDIPVTLPPTSTNSYFLLVSDTGDATGGWTVSQWQFNAAGSLFDFPDLGIDNSGIVVTGNVTPGGGVATAVPKEVLYNYAELDALGLATDYFTLSWQAFDTFLAPPVLSSGDSNSVDWILAADQTNDCCAGTGARQVELYAMTDTGTGFPLMEYVNPVPVNFGYYWPPAAIQPGCSPDSTSQYAIDTYQALFMTPSAQTPATSQYPGGTLFQVHTVDLGGVPSVEYYQIDPSTQTVIQDNYIYRSSTSNDFNASIAANAQGDAFVTWNATDPGTSSQAMILFGDRHVGDPVNTMNLSSAALITSSVCLEGEIDTLGGHQRWGDFSTAVIDPVTSSNAWVVNEYVGSSIGWATQIGEIQE